MKRSKQDKIFDTIVEIFLCILLVIWIYPLYFTVIAGISDPYEVALGKVLLFPKKITLEAYETIFKTKAIWVGYANTILYTLCGTLFDLVLTIPAAYGLSKKNMPFRGPVTTVFLITMFFGGGLVPTYLLIRDLSLLDTRVVLILVGGVSAYNLIVARTFFQTSIPDELYEAGKIDGASEYRMFFNIALPLSIPIIAVIGLYYGVGHWNSYMSALLYVTDQDKQPLQLILKRILISSKTPLTDAAENLDEEALKELARRAYMSYGIKYAVVFVASFPLLCAYPFIQKYFVKGVMIGAVKG